MGIKLCGGEERIMSKYCTPKMGDFRTPDVYPFDVVCRRSSWPDKMGGLLLPDACLLGRLQIFFLQVTVLEPLEQQDEGPPFAGRLPRACIN